MRPRRWSAPEVRVRGDARRVDPETHWPPRGSTGPDCPARRPRWRRGQTYPDRGPQSRDADATRPAPSATAPARIFPNSGSRAHRPTIPPRCGLRPRAAVASHLFAPASHLLHRRPSHLRSLPALSRRVPAACGSSLRLQGPVPGARLARLHPRRDPPNSRPLRTRSHPDHLLPDRFDPLATAHW